MAGGIVKIVRGTGLHGVVAFLAQRIFQRGSIPRYSTIYNIETSNLGEFDSLRFHQFYGAIVLMGTRHTGSVIFAVQIRMAPLSYE